MFFLAKYSHFLGMVINTKKIDNNFKPSFVIAQKRKHWNKKKNEIRVENRANLESLNKQ